MRLCHIKSFSAQNFCSKFSHKKLYNTDITNFQKVKIKLSIYSEQILFQLWIQNFPDFYPLRRLKMRNKYTIFVIIHNTLYEKV